MTLPAIFKGFHRLRGISISLIGALNRKPRSVGFVRRLFGSPNSSLEKQTSIVEQPLGVGRRGHRLEKECLHNNLQGTTGQWRYASTPFLLFGCTPKGRTKTTKGSQKGS